MSYVNHNSAKGLARRFMGSEGMRIGQVYMILAKENRRGGGILVKRGS
jgi:hypothetical protein